MGKKYRGRVAILTGGGDTCALNKSIETIKNMSYLLDYQIYGVYGGWKGLMGDGFIVDISEQDINGNIGGSILGSSRTNPYKIDANGKTHEDEVLRNIKRYGIDIIISIGGDDTNSVSQRLFKEQGIPVIGFPKTIDNDINTQTIHQIDEKTKIDVALCPGFPTATEKINNLIANLRTTAMTHGRIFIVEIMGRNAGWLPASAIYGGADFILIPEIEMTKERIELFMKKLEAKYREQGNIIVGVSEGVKWWNDEKGKCEEIRASQEVDAFGHPRLGGIAAHIANEIRKRKINDPRAQVTGYIPRSGYISEYDEKLASALGQRVLKMVLNEEFGKMPVLTKIVKYRELEAYNTKTIELADLTNKSFPYESYYDEDNFTVNKHYTSFIEKMIPYKLRLPQKIKYTRIIPE